MTILLSLLWKNSGGNLDSAVLTGVLVGGGVGTTGTTGITGTMTVGSAAIDNENVVELLVKSGKVPITFTVNVPWSELEADGTMNYPPPGI